MKAWILPTLAVAAVIFLISKPGRELQEQIGDNLGDWTDDLIRSTERLQKSLGNVQSILDRCNRTLHQVAG